MFKTRLRDLRLSRGLQQKELAAALNLDYKRYNHYETGRSEPDNHVLSVIADFSMCPLITCSVDLTAPRLHVTICLKWPRRLMIRKSCLLCWTLSIKNYKRENRRI